jgi:hypothetical protein
LFAANSNRKLPFVFCKRKMEVCFPWSANDKLYIIDVCGFSKRAHLYKGHLFLIIRLYESATQNKIRFLKSHSAVPLIQELPQKLPRCAGNIRFAVQTVALYDNYVLNM